MTSGGANNRDRGAGRLAWGFMFGKTFTRTARLGWAWAATAALLLVVSACNRGGDEAEPTTSASVTTAAVATTEEVASETAVTAANEQSAPDEGAGETAAATTAPPATSGDVRVIIPPYQVVSEGEPLVAVVEPGSYSAVALENLVYDIVEKHSPSTAIVVDDASAAELALAEDLDEVQQSQLRARTLLRIESGVQVTFYGPYADLPGITVGS